MHRFGYSSQVILFLSHAFRFTHIHMQPYTYIHTNRHIHTDLFTQTLADKLTHTHTHTHRHTHRHTLILALLYGSLDEGLHVPVGLQEAVLELAGLRVRASHNTSHTLCSLGARVGVN